MEATILDLIQIYAESNAVRYIYLYKGCQKKNSSQFSLYFVFVFESSWMQIRQICLRIRDWETITFSFVAGLGVTIKNSHQVIQTLQAHLEKHP